MTSDLQDMDHNPVGQACREATRGLPTWILISTIYMNGAQGLAVDCERCKQKTQMAMPANLPAMQRVLWQAERAHGDCLPEKVDPLAVQAAPVTP